MVYQWFFLFCFVLKKQAYSLLPKLPGHISFLLFYHSLGKHKFTKCAFSFTSHKERHFNSVQAEKGLESSVLDQIFLKKKNTTSVSLVVFSHSSLWKIYRQMKHKISKILSQMLASPLNQFWESVTVLMATSQKTDTKQGHNILFKPFKARYFSELEFFRF